MQAVMQKPPVHRAKYKMKHLVLALSFAMMLGRLEVFTLPTYNRRLNKATRDHGLNESRNIYRTEISSTEKMETSVGIESLAEGFVRETIM